MKKEDFKQKTAAVLEELSDYIAKLEDKAEDITEDAKEEYREQLEKLKGIKVNLSSKLDEFENVADSKWDVVKESAGNFFASVTDSWKENFGKVADALKKDKMTNDPVDPAHSAPFDDTQKQA
jgi:Zn-dependent M32 family carboxypeptidase